MKGNSNKISTNSELSQNQKSNRSKNKKSKNSSNEKNSAHSPSHQGDSNSNHKISRLDTNESRNSASNNSFKSKNISKRFKTEQKSQELTNISERLSYKKQSGSTKRLRTDLTERIDSPKQQQQRFQDDHHNTASLAELLQFHTGYHDIDQQQFNYRVRKETEGSKIENQRKQSNSRANSIVEIELGDNEKTQQEEEQEDKNDEEEDEKNIKQSKESNEITSKKDKSKKSINSNNFDDDEDEDEDVPEIQSDYTLGAILSNNSKKDEPNFKKKQPKIRSFSNDEKRKIISECKYVPKTECQYRMEARYLKGQLETIKELREAEEMGYFMTEYKNNKKKLMQQTAKKIQMNRLAQNMKTVNKKSATFDIKKKSVSLPKLRTYQELTLPQPEDFVRQFSQDEKKIIKNTNPKLEGSLSANRFNFMKKQSSLKNIKNKEHFYTQIQNVEHIESVLRSKGIQFDVNAIRKGLMNLKIPEFQSGKLQYPKNLISNPKYQKYPL